MVSKLFLDIEAGGFSGERSSILSLSWGTGKDINTAYAPPVPQSELSRWSEKNVWEPIKHLVPKGSTEKDILSQFLSVLESAPAETQLVGWNIGYKSGGGYDLKMLQQRASVYGLEERYAAALEKFQIVDLGQEFALKMARAVVRHGKPLVKQGLLQEEMFEQAVGYVKQSIYLRRKFNLPSLEHTPEYLAQYNVTKEGYVRSVPTRFAGWKQELATELFGTGAYAAHQSAEDVAALRKLLPKVAGEEFSSDLVRAWAPLALKNKLIASATSIPRDVAEEIPARFTGLLAEARSAGIEQRFLSDLEKVVAQQGGRMKDVYLGKGIVREYTTARATKFAQEISAFKGLSATVDAGASIIRKHPLVAGLALGTGLLFAAKPLQFFSGKDDEYNTIAGLPHGGVAQQKRQNLTEFGSGWKGLWSKISKAPGQARRAAQVAQLINLESNRAVAKITKEIAHGAKSGKALELGVVGLTVAKVGMLAADIAATGAVTAGQLTGTGAAFIATKYAYEAIKKRKAIASAVQFTKAHPQEVKLGVQVGSEILKSEVAAYIKTGQRNVMSTYIRAGGGEYGRQAVLSHLETMPAKYKESPEFETIAKAFGRVMGKDDFWNTIEGLQHGGMAETLRKGLTEFGSGWRGIASLPEVLQPLGRKAGVAAQAGKPSEIGRFFARAVMEDKEKGLMDIRKAAVNQFFGGLQQQTAVGQDIIVLNKQAIEAEAKRAGVEYSRLLKGTIKHERFHQALTASGRRSELLSEVQVPASFKKTYQKAMEAQRLPVSEELIKEEYLAHGITESYIRNKTPKEYQAAQDAMGRIEQELGQHFLKRSKPRLTKPASSIFGPNRIPGGMKGTGTDFGSPVDLSKAVNRASKWLTKEANYFLGQRTVGRTWSMTTPAGEAFFKGTEHSVTAGSGQGVLKMTSKQFYRKLAHEGTLDRDYYLDVLEGIKNKEGSKYAPFSLDELRKKEIAHAPIGKAYEIAQEWGVTEKLAAQNTVVDYKPWGQKVFSHLDPDATGAVTPAKLPEEMRTGAAQIGNSQLERAKKVADQMNRKNTPTIFNKMKGWFQKHRDSQIRASTNAHRPGMRHTQQTGRLVL